MPPIRYTVLLVASAAGLTLNPGFGSAQDLSDTAPAATAARRSVGVSLRVDGRSEIAVDGNIDDADWASVPTMTNFVQREPTEGLPAEQQTEVRMLFDDEALYIAARLYDDQPSTIARQLVRRDEWGQYDYF